MSEKESKAKAQQEAPPEQPMFTASANDISQVALMPPHEYKARMQAQVFDHAEKNKTQETVSGGAYVVDGQWVDANGNPLKEAPKSSRVDVEAETASDEDIKAHPAKP